jgi:hypothetical protein
MRYRMEKGEYRMVCYGTLIRTDHLLRSPFSTSTSLTTVLYHPPSSSLPIYNITHHHHHLSPLHQHIVVVVPRSHHRDDPYLFHRPAWSRTVTHRHAPSRTVTHRHAPSRTVTHRCPSSLPSPSLLSLIVIDHHRRSRHPTSLIVTPLSSSPTIVALTVSSLNSPQGETRSDREC